MEIKLPRKLELKNITAFLNKAIGPNNTPISNNINFDISSLKFIYPDAVASWSNLIYWLSEQNCRCTFSGFNPANESHCYLDDAQFFRIHVGNTIRESAALRNTTIPLKHVRNEESYAWMEFEMVPWLANRLQISNVSLAEIKTCFQELFHNIRDHSGKENGCVFIQHFPHEYIVHVGLADIGVGIPNAVRRVDPRLGDDDAILKAFEEGFSTRSSPHNRGAGLDVLVNYVTVHNQGSLIVHSGYGRVGASPDDHGGTVYTSETSRDVAYPGTLFSLRFRTDTIEHIPEEDSREDLEW